MAPTFNFNIAFTIAVNANADEVILTAPELWQGIKRGGRNPNDFADYVAACEVLSGGRKEFRRRLTLADGAVHTPAGAKLDQDVWISDNLSVREMANSLLPCIFKPPRPQVETWHERERERERKK
jgi:Domain of unknown function (DUF1857)